VTDPPTRATGGKDLSRAGASKQSDGRCYEGERRQNMMHGEGSIHGRTAASMWGDTAKTRKLK